MKRTVAIIWLTKDMIKQLLNFGGLQSAQLSIKDGFNLTISYVWPVICPYDQ